MTIPDRKGTYGAFADIVAAIRRPDCDHRTCTSPAFAWMQHDECESLPRLLCDVHAAQFRTLIAAHGGIKARAYCPQCQTGYDPASWHVNPI